MGMEHYWNDRDRVKPLYLEKNCPSSTPSTINPKHTGLTMNTGLHGEQLVTEQWQGPVYSDSLSVKR
jgi:hypothetical protein